MQSNYMDEFYVMDVILNRRAAPLTAVSGGGNAVCHAQSYVPEDGAPDGDYQFRGGDPLPAPVWGILLQL